VAVIDGNIIDRDNWEIICQTGACAVQTATCHPMKYVAFYYLDNCTKTPSTNFAPLVYTKLKSLTEPLSSFAMIQVHNGQLNQSEDLQIDYLGLTQLAKGLTQLVYYVIGQLNE